MDPHRIVALFVSVARSRQFQCHRDPAGVCSCLCLLLLAQTGSVSVPSVAQAAPGTPAKHNATIPAGSSSLQSVYYLLFQCTAHCCAPSAMRVASVIQDLDCFYAQVETLKRPHLAGIPVGITQVQTCSLALAAARGAVPALVYAFAPNLCPRTGST